MQHASSLHIKLLSTLLSHENSWVFTLILGIRASHIMGFSAAGSCRMWVRMLCLSQGIAPSLCSTLRCTRKQRKNDHNRHIERGVLHYHPHAYTQGFSHSRYLGISLLWYYRRNDPLSQCHNEPTCISLAAK